MITLKKRFIARVINWEGMILANICDEELVGQTIKGGEVEMYISPDYFGGEALGLEGALALVRSSPMVNLVGERIIMEVLKAKLASKQAVKKIGATYFLMIFKFTR